jgi:hypothetical protein
MAIQRSLGLDIENREKRDLDAGFGCAGSGMAVGGAACPDRPEPLEL